METTGQQQSRRAHVRDDPSYGRSRAGAEKRLSGNSWMRGHKYRRAAVNVSPPEHDKSLVSIDMVASLNRTSE